MRILVLCKRRYTGKDLISERYGRLYEIPAALAARGHDIRGVALSYERTDSGWHRLEQAAFAWWSVNALPSGLARYDSVISRVTADWKPDVIWASSDMLHAALGARQSRRRGVPFVIDLYDNYESFGMARIPGMRTLFRSACRQADGISVVSHTLASLMRAMYGPEKDISVIINGVDKDVFRPRPKKDSRAILGLPEHASLIGTAGSITGDRGIADMFQAFEQLVTEHEDLWLVYAGPRDHTPSRYQHPRIIDLGVLSLDVVPVLLSALDVAIICNRDSDFGRYCFPMKLYEIIACRVPLMAAATGDVARVLSSFPDNLYTPGNSTELANKIGRLLQGETGTDRPDATSWQGCALQLEQLLQRISGPSGYEAERIARL